MSANMYRVGDYVFFETSSTAPYQIRRIEELNKTQNGNVEAKVMCFYRRRDISNSLILLADKHHNTLEEETEEDRDVVEDETEQRKDFQAFPMYVKLLMYESLHVKFVGYFFSYTAQKNAFSSCACLKVNLKVDESSSPLEDGDVKESTGKVTAVEENGTDTTTNGNNNNNNHGGRGMEEIPEKLRHQLKHRELFLSRQVETLPATHIRGKCCVTLLNETESLLSYLNKEDTFFYSLVYDPQQKTLLADKGEIRVGSKYQAETIPRVYIDKATEDLRKLEDLEELVWDPNNGLSDKEIDQFQIVARSVGTFARALDCTSTVRQPSLHMSAAAASRDITIFHAMDTLHRHAYDIAKAIKSLVPSGGPVLCRDEMEEWSASEANLFEDAIEKYGKDFNDIRQDFLPWKSLKSIVEYYYMWKTTDRYVQQKRIKASEAESKLKQVYIPNYNKPNPAAINTKVNGTDGPVSGRACESCYTAHSSQWYSWGPIHMQCRLCSNCWSYWKKYGGLKMPTRLDGERPAPNARQGMRYSSLLLLISSVNYNYSLNGSSRRRARPSTCTAGFHRQDATSFRIFTELQHILGEQPPSTKRIPRLRIGEGPLDIGGQLRLTDRGNSYQSALKSRTPTTLDPVVSRLGIDTKQEKPSLLARGPHCGGGDPSSMTKERPAENVKVGSGHPSIMKKRGYEQTNGMDSAPLAKRPNMGVIRQAGAAIKTPGVTRRGSVLNHNSINGRSRFAGRNMKMHMVSWMDMPDDVYFVATMATRKIRKQLQMNDFKRLARNPWKSLNVKPPLPSGSFGNGHRVGQQEIVVLD
uniref:Metastasis-associated protein MTA1 n=1 Tax=Biomphalaria glabrata TaxID=6526 RepID=A0A2C9JPS8_BIOGL